MIIICQILSSSHQQYLPRLSRMLLVMVYGDDDHYHVNYMKPDLAELPYAGNQCISLSAINGGGLSNKKLHGNN